MAIRINGREYDWSDINVNMLGNAKPIYGLTDIGWDEDASNEYHHGIGTEPVGYTVGPSKYAGSMKFMKGELDQVRAALGGGNLTKIPPFDIVISFSAGPNLSMVVIKGVLITKDSQSQNTGTRLIDNSLSFVCAGIEHS